LGTAGGEIEPRPGVGEHSATSSYRSSVFERFSADDAAALIAEYPLAWVLPRGRAVEEGTLLPLLAERDEDGHIVRLIGHMARSNPLWGRLHGDPAASILFQGPQGYVSPETVGRRDWVPTWNFAQLRIEANVAFHLDGGDAALALLVDAMEQGRSNPWRVEETGPRYAQMVNSIIAFDASVISLRGRFKLGQDESPETLKAIVDNHPDAALVRWMKRFNEGRY